VSVSVCVCVCVNMCEHARTVKQASSATDVAKELSQQRSEIRSNCTRFTRQHAFVMITASATEHAVP